MDEKKLLKYSIDYLSKYDSSKSNLVKILKNKIFRMNITGFKKKELIDLIENIIHKLENNNLINDNRYSASKISSFTRLGKSKIYIFNYLIKKGINKKDIENNFKLFEKNDNDWELNSAKLFAMKKKLLNSDIDYEKRLAKMARAGFNYDICKKVLG